MAITIEPLGGLGNQLFTYALGLNLAIKHGTDLHADLWNFHKYPWHIYELDSFQNSIALTYSSRSREILGHRARRFQRLLPVELPIAIGSRLHLEREFCFDESLLDVGDGTRLAGYFQSWKYFEPIAALLRAQLRRPTHVSEWFLRTKAELSHLNEWIAVHVRRGNFSLIEAMGLVGYDYYRRSVSLMRELEGDLPLVVFSDNPEQLDYARLFGDRDVTAVVAPPSVRAVEVLLLMSYASHIIMGNSTFSWWAAFQGDQSGRRVIAPRPWLNDRRYNERDLLPLEWITLGHEFQAL